MKDDFGFQVGENKCRNGVATEDMVAESGTCTVLCARHGEIWTVRMGRSSLGAFFYYNLSDTLLFRTFLGLVGQIMFFRSNK